MELFGQPVFLVSKNREVKAGQHQEGFPAPCGQVNARGRRGRPEAGHRYRKSQRGGYTCLLGKAVCGSRGLGSDVGNGMEVPSEKFGESRLPAFPRTTSESVSSICGQRVRPYREHSQPPGLSCDWLKAKTISSVRDWLQPEHWTQF